MVTSAHKSIGRHRQSQRIASLSQYPHKTLMRSKEKPTTTTSSFSIVGPIPLFIVETQT
jgi:hypothetical protein